MLISKIKLLFRRMEHNAKKFDSFTCLEPSNFVYEISITPYSFKIIAMHGSFLCIR